MTRIPWRGFLAAVLSGLAALTVGCGNDNTGSGLTTGEMIPENLGTPPGSELRIVHATPDVPLVDIYFQGWQEPLIRGVAYGTVTRYFNAPYGSFALEFRPAGASASSPPVLVGDPITLIPAMRVTAIATGLSNPQTPETAFRVMSFLEGFSPTSPGTARVRIAHAAADAPAVGIDLGNDGFIEVPRLERFAGTASAGLELRAGISQQVGIVSADTAQPLTSFTLPPLPAGGEIFLVPIGLLSQAPRDPEGFTLITVGPEGRTALIKQNPVVYALHASPDAPEVDIFAAGNELADGLGFGELSAPIQVPPGLYTLDFFGHQPGRDQPTGAPAARGMTPLLEAGEQYLLVASGFLRGAGDAPGFSLLAYSAGFTEAEDWVRLRVVHASPDAPPVDVGPQTGPGLLPEQPPFEDVAYSEATEPEGVALAPAPVTVGVTAAPDDARQPVATFSMDLGPFQGAGVFVVAAGALRPREDQEGFRLVLVDTSTTPWSAQALPPR